MLFIWYMQFVWVWYWSESSCDWFLSVFLKKTKKSFRFKMEPTQDRFKVEKIDGKRDFGLCKHTILCHLEIIII